MRPTNLDPTAGETARAIRRDPEATRRIGDPTDPRYGDPSRMGAGEEPHVFDPTDPVCEGPPPSA
jgi:hypothetical protein